MAELIVTAFQVGITLVLFALVVGLVSWGMMAAWHALFAPPHKHGGGNDGDDPDN